jgi:L-ribulokinase
MRGAGGSDGPGVGVGGRRRAAVEALAIDTTGFERVPVDEKLQPLDDYYLWCDHRAGAKRPRSPRPRERDGLEAIGGAAASTRPSGASRSCCTGCATTRTSGPHGHRAGTLRHGGGGAVRHHRSGAVPRSVCAMGHKWMWNESLGGLPPEEFLTAVDPLLAGVREKIAGRVRHRTDRRAHFARNGRRSSGCGPGIPIPVGAFDAHWDAIGAGVPHRRRGERGRHLDLHHGDRPNR